MSPDPIREALSDEPHTRWGYCSPRDADERRWVIIFDDADRPPIVITDEKAARTAFARLEMSWNCYLMETTKRAALARPVDQGAAAPEKIAPVQGYTPGIPWSLHLEAYDAYSKRWAPQPAMIDLEGRNCRGGFSTGELDQFIPGWRDRVSEIGKLKARVAELEAVAPQLPSVDQGAPDSLLVRLGVCPHCAKPLGLPETYQELRRKIAAIPRRQEYIGGQLHSYIHQGDTLDTLDAFFVAPQPSGEKS